MNKNLNISMFLLTLSMSYNAFAITPQLNTGKTKTILAGSRTPEQNLKNQLYCSKLGGIDITNDSDVVIGENTIDATFCQINESNNYNSESIPFNHAGAGAGVVESDGSLTPYSNNETSVNQFNELASGTWRAEAANATLPMGQTWWIRGAGYFNNIVGSTIFTDVRVPDFNCSASNSKTNFTGNAQLTAQVQCGASQGRPSTKNYVSACVNGQCNQAVGTIFFR